MSVEWDLDSLQDVITNRIFLGGKSHCGFIFIKIIISNTPREVLPTLVATKQVWEGSPVACLHCLQHAWI